MTAKLYEQDYYLWLKKTAELLQTDRLAEVDIPNLIEEIEDMGKSVRQATRNNLIVVLMHLLKYSYQPERRSDSWLDSIVEHRRRIDLALEDSPSLKPYLEEVFPDCYRKARQDAARQTKLPINIFPEVSPFSVEETLNPDWLPDQ
jgi:hypothetical protein